MGITFNQEVDILGKKCLISQNLPVDILGITFNQGVDILGKKCLISQHLPVDILGVDNMAKIIHRFKSLFVGFKSLFVGYE